MARSFDYLARARAFARYIEEREAELTMARDFAAREQEQDDPALDIIDRADGSTPRERQLLVPPCSPIFCGTMPRA